MTDTDVQDGVVRQPYFTEAVFRSPLLVASTGKSPDHGGPESTFRGFVVALIVVAAIAALAMFAAEVF